MKKSFLIAALVVVCVALFAQTANQTAVSTHIYPGLDTNNVFTGPDQFILGVGVGPANFSKLGAPVNGHIIYCADCAQVTPCAGNGNGAIAEAINGAWACAGGANAGTITGVLTQAGSGLAGGSLMGSPAISLYLNCLAGQIEQWSGTAWVCSSAGVGTLTGIQTPAGSGLSGGGTTGSPSITMRTDCGANQSEEWTGTQWICFIPGTTTGVFTAVGSGLQGGTGNPGEAIISLLQTCGTSQILQWNGSAWVCASPASGSIPTNSAGQSITGNGSATAVATSTFIDGSAPGLPGGGTDPFAAIGGCGGVDWAVGTNYWLSGYINSAGIAEPCNLIINSPMVPITVHVGASHYLMAQDTEILIENAPGTDIECDGAILDWSASAPNPGVVSITGGSVSSTATVSGGTLSNLIQYVGDRLIVAGVVVGTITGGDSTHFFLAANYSGTTITNAAYNVIGGSTQDHIIIQNSPGTKLRGCTVMGDVFVAGGNTTGHNCINVIASDGAVIQNDALYQCGSQGVSITNSNDTYTNDLIVAQSSGSGWALGATIPPMASSTVTLSGTTATIGFSTSILNLIFPGMKISVAGFTSTHAAMNCPGCTITAVGGSSVTYTATSSGSFSGVSDTNGTVTVLPFLNNVVDGVWALDANISPGSHIGNYAINVSSSGYYGALKGVTISNWHVDNNVACTLNGTTCTGDGVTHVCNTNAPDSQPLGPSSTGSCGTGGLQVTNNVTDYDIGHGSCRNTYAECTAEGGQRWTLHDIECFRGHVDQFGTPLDNGSGCWAEYAAQPGLMTGFTVHDVRFAGSGYGGTIQNGQNAVDNNVVADGDVHDLVSFADTIPTQLSLNGAMTSGSAVLSTTPDTNFALGIVGATITVAGAGPSGGLLTATVLSRSSSSSVTLSAVNSSGGNVTGAQVIRTMQNSLAGIALKNNSPVGCNGFDGTISITGTAVTGVGTTFNAATDNGIVLKIGATSYGAFTVTNTTSGTVATAAGNVSNSAYTLQRQCKWTITDTSFHDLDLTNTHTQWATSSLTVLAQPLDIYVAGPEGWSGLTPQGTRALQVPGGFDSYNAAYLKQIPNAPSGGTGANLLVKIGGSGLVTALTTDTSGIVGICTSQCGTASAFAQAIVAWAAIVPCQFDGTPTATHWVQISSSVAGNCTDAGSTRPTAGQILGRVISQSSGTIWNIDLETEDIPPATTNTPTTLTDGSTVTWATTGGSASSTLLFTVHSGTRTLNLTGLTSGAFYSIALQQDGTGGEGLLIPAGNCSGGNFKVAGGGAGLVSLTNAANAIDTLNIWFVSGVCLVNVAHNYN